eukprot:6212366-Pleurochrysis_carterae.AAC.1
MAAVRAAGEVYELPLAAESDNPIGSYVYCGADCHRCEMMETIVYMGLRAILRCSTAMASLHYRSGRVLIFGWTMMCKWDHPVATLSSDEGDYTSLCGRA